MLVAGAWHGTTLNFVVFGLVHGVALVVARGYEHVMVRRMGRAGFDDSPSARLVPPRPCSPTTSRRSRTPFLSWMSERACASWNGWRNRGAGAMTGRRRLTLKLVWMAALMTTLVLLGQVRHDFIYQGF